MVELVDSELEVLREGELTALVVREAEGLEEVDLASAELDTVAGIVLFWLAGAATEELETWVSVTGQMVV